jgi:hypothetical protein
MSKINQSNNNPASSISQNKAAPSSARVQENIDFDIKEKGFYKREVKLLRDEIGNLIGTEGGDNLLLSIEDRDTVQVTSDITGLHNIDNG